MSIKMRIICACIFLVQNTFHKNKNKYTHNFKYGNLNHKINFVVRSNINTGDADLKMNLYQIRTDRELTLRELAKLTDISRGRLNNIENQKSRSPDLTELETLAKALDCRIYDLFDSDFK